ncbi:MAG: phosphate signaling complex protein PhoU [Deltaproteobacteria bacterium]|nr:phosphate signaling complex protein PhoU [Deltaproteobacteria bacterium]
MNTHFQKELDKIKKMLLSLGAAVEQRVQMAGKAITDIDAILAEDIIDRDHEIDTMEMEVEDECLKALALYQPVAVDLRFLIAVIKINNDLERIGDQAVNIAQRVQILAKHDRHIMQFDYTSMAEKAQDMLKKSLDSLVNMDLELAHHVIFLDDEVDSIKHDAYDRIKVAMSKHPTQIGYLINLLLISRHLERLADHATNIAEEVVYMIEGEVVRHTSL